MYYDAFTGQSNEDRIHTEDRRKDWAEQEADVPPLAPEEWAALEAAAPTLAAWMRESYAETAA